MLNMGKEVKTVTAIYDHGVLLHIYQAPLVRLVAPPPSRNGELVFDIGCVLSCCDF